jgi:biofilm protein TabA
MVLDRLEHSHKYVTLHRALPRAFEFLGAADWSRLAAAASDDEERHTRHAIDGDRMYVSIDRARGRGRASARLEAHRRYLDIQLTIDGDEEIGWRPLAACVQPDGPYDSARDVGFFRDRPDSWLSLPPGSFAIFFPDDAHAPLAGRGMLSKAIMKIAID